MTTKREAPVEFLLARIAEDEAMAHEHKAMGAVIGSPNVARIWAGTAARVLADCAAKRRIVELMAATDSADVHPDAWTAMKMVLRDLASVHADHPDYRQEWKP